jgi:hypothetical protein
MVVNDKRLKNGNIVRLPQPIFPSLARPGQRIRDRPGSIFAHIYHHLFITESSSVYQVFPPLADENHHQDWGPNQALIKVESTHE